MYVLNGLIFNLHLNNHKAGKKKAALKSTAHLTNYNPMNISKINSLVFYLVGIYEE